MVAAVRASPDSAITLDVGGKQSHLEYTNSKSVPVLAISKGELGSVGRVVVNFAGVPSSQESDTMVDIELALAAVREYCEMDSLPTCIDWIISQDNRRQ